MAQERVWKDVFAADSNMASSQFQNSFDIYVALQEFFENEEAKQEKQFELVKTLFNRQNELYDNLPVLTCTLEYASKVLNNYGVGTFTQQIAS